MPFLRYHGVGSSFREGKLMEADEPIPMRLRAHLLLGEERARGMGFRVCIITREANVYNYDLYYIYISAKLRPYGM